MLKSLTPITLAAVLAMTAPLAAQETTAEETDTTEQAAGAETAEQQPSDLLLDYGEVVENETQVGQRYIKEEHGDWNLACIKAEVGHDPCSLMQVLTGPNGNPIAEFSLFRLTENGGQAVAGATLIVPLEVHLPRGVSLSVDGAPSKRYNFRLCSQVGCLTQIALTDGDIKAFKNGKEAIVTMTAEPYLDRIVELKMSLKGFTAGYDVVDVVKQ
ncbi:invasion associated locus B family protein [Leisingera sp. ANG-M7]|uniref:invasion associated locus B family protein n=1 Tax=Leisingera sp. ANG-M7 TaxID=1577902 RepID=UPI00057EB208|nr:invasion associated locus B family protein [Leisingera sp. ANG-M7]KIC37514.1 invasion protein [Leisingera sp. ANG-M7]